MYQHVDIIVHLAAALGAQPVLAAALSPECVLS